MGALIGVFDSGVGGLSVLRACVKRLPALRFLYLGDNGRAPYGSRSPEEISAFAQEGLEQFRKRGVAAAVLACNTATAVCLDEMRERFSFPILGTEPAVLPAAKEGRRVLVLCTPRTAESGRLKALICRCPQTQFTVHACPNLAAAIEGRLLRGEPLCWEEHLPAGDFDGVALGCTHYALFRGEIAAFYNAPVYDGAEGIARRLGVVLSHSGVDSGWMKREQINKSLPSKWEENGGTNVCFIGKSAKINREIFKQTF